MAKWKHLKNKSVLLTGLFVIRCATARSLLEAETTVGYPLNEPRISLRIVVGEGQRDKISYFKRLALDAVKRVEGDFQLQFRDSFSIVFDNRPDYANGLTTVIPTNRVYVYTEPANLESSVGLTREAYLETTVHELTHMIVLQQRSSIYTPLGWIFGNLSRPLVVFPRWIHEGLAVWEETKLEGRGTNGIVQAELRKYAEYYQRNKKHPLSSDQLDGNLPTRRVAEGTYPYHFGYLLIDDLMKGTQSKSPGELIRGRSGHLGFLFHSMYRDNGKVLTTRFEALRDEWAATPIESDQSEKVSSAQRIIGPFLSDEGITWIEDGKDGGAYRYLQTSGAAPAESPNLSRRTKAEHSFDRAGMTATQAFYSRTKEAWIMLAYFANPSTSHAPEKSILMVDRRGNVQCENNELHRIRELTIDGDNLAWIRSDKRGFVFFEKASFNSHCELGPVQELYKTELPFERLSHPWMRGDQWLLSRSQGKDLSQDYIVGSGGFEYHAPEGALGFPQRLQTPDCDCLLVSWYKKDYRGPAMLNLKSNELATWPQVTEIPASYAMGGKIYSNQALWEEDRLITHTLAQAKPAPVPQPAATERPPIPTFSEAVDPRDEVSAYGAWPTVLPRWWFPNFQAYNRGFTVTGNTLFEDLSGNWNGALTAGYDSGAHRPLGSLLLNKNSLTDGMLDQWSLAADSTFHYVGESIQDSIVALTQFRLVQRLNTRFFAALFPGVEYRRGSNADLLRAYSVFAPSLGFTFASPTAVDVRQQAYQITKFTDAFYFSGRARWLPQTSYELATNFQGKAGKFGYLLGVEYGETPAAAFPKVYYEWGGRAPFSMLDSGYLARGFKSSIGPALRVARGTAEFGFSLLKVNRGTAWNRFHVTDIELRPLYEVITSDLYTIDVDGSAVPLNVRMGNEYFQTYGAELDFFFQVLHYLDLKATAGIYQGIGRAGHTQYGLRLVTLLDLLK